jgi:hypothetical protein
MNKRIFVILVLLATYPQTPMAIERLSLQVVCNFAEERYRRDLNGGEIAEIERNCASDVAKLLGDKIGFLDFVAGETRGNQLRLKLGKTKNEADPTAIRAVNFDIVVSGTDVKEKGEPVVWEFRDIHGYLDVPSSVETFSDAIAVRFAEILEHNARQLVSNQLGRLAIADTAYPMPAARSWLLPFSREELGIAHRSQFKIKAGLIFPASNEEYIYYVVLVGDFETSSNVPVEFHHKGKALHQHDDVLPKEESIENLENASEVKVQYVTVYHYEPISEPESTSPSNLDTTGGAP